MKPLTIQFTPYLPTLSPLSPPTLSQTEILKIKRQSLYEPIMDNRPKQSKLAIKLDMWKEHQLLRPADLMANIDRKSVMVRKGGFIERYGVLRGIYGYFFLGVFCFWLFENMELVFKGSVGGILVLLFLVFFIEGVGLVFIWGVRFFLMFHLVGVVSFFGIFFCLC